MSMSIAELGQVSNSYTLYESVRDALRVSSTKYDSEVFDTIAFAVNDLITKGVSPAWLGDDVDNLPSLAKQAIVVYAKASFGFDNDESERLMKSYDSIVCTILNSSHNAVYEKRGIPAAGVSPIEPQTYTGEEVKPPVSVFAIVAGVEVQLAEGVDYTVAYDHNIEVGWAIATVTGIFPYVGSIEVPFAIEAAS